MTFSWYQYIDQASNSLYLPSLAKQNKEHTIEELSKRKLYLRCPDRISREEENLACLNNLNLKTYRNQKNQQVKNCSPFYLARKNYKFEISVLWKLLKFLTPQRLSRRQFKGVSTVSTEIKKGGIHREWCTDALVGVVGCCAAPRAVQMKRFTTLTIRASSIVLTVADVIPRFVQYTP